MIDAPLVAPSARTWIEWTPDLIRAAMQLADGGSLRLAADLCEAMLGDDRVQGALNLRARGLLGLPLSFERAGDGRRAGRAVRHLDAEQDFWTAFPQPTLGKLNAWGVLLGVGLAQSVWTEIPAGRVLPVLEWWHPRNLRWDAMARGWWVRTVAGEVALEVGTARWVFYAPGGTPRPWVDGAWRAIAPWWLLKTYAKSDWGVEGERARGLLAVKPPAPGASGVLPDSDQRRAHRQRLAEQLRTLGRNGVIVLPDGFDLSLVQAAANTWQTYKGQVDAANTAIAIALTGTNLTTEVTGGSYAAAEVHRAVSNTLLTADAGALGACLHDGPLRWWAFYNFGDPELAPWPAWDTTPPEDLAALVGAWGAAADAAAKFRDLGVDVDVAEIARRVRLPLRGPRGTA
jgi:hypothetical protein